MFKGFRCRKRKCWNKQSSTAEGCFSLDSVTNNFEGYIVDICNEKKTRNRVVSLGLNIGNQIRVIKQANSARDSLILKLGFSQIILNYEIAKCIFVSQNPPAS